MWLAAVWWTYAWFHKAALQTTAQQTTATLQLQVRDLLGSVNKFEHLPYLVGAERTLSALLQAPTDATLTDQANRYLAFAQQRSDVAAIYLIDPQGQTLAASNWASSPSFVGQNYRFRPYFQSAIRGQTGFFYGVGVTTGEPGAFIAAPVLRRPEASSVWWPSRLPSPPLKTSGAKQVSTSPSPTRKGSSFSPPNRHGATAACARCRRLFCSSCKTHGNTATSIHAPLTRTEPVALEDGLRQLTLEDGKKLLMQTQSMGHLGWQMLHFSDPLSPQTAGHAGRRNHRTEPRAC